jgi:NADH-quinone oxidoreductase subunit L
MEWSLHALFLLPALGYVISLLIPKRNESILSKVSFSTVALQFLASLFFSFEWIWNGQRPIDHREITLFSSADYHFYIEFYFDKISMTFLILGALLTFIITVYSRYYLHREIGYKRFFNVISLFYLGYNLVVISGNLETLFIGWEILGISSFLLIVFYRDRYLPVKNGVKVFSIYRIGDVGIILTIWLSHHLWHENISFIKLNNYELVHDQLIEHSALGLIISFLLFVAASAKSAQLPFSSWLPRAMEGPTPSSAIFYGSLSVHIGAFLLMRTYSFWEHQLIFRYFVGIMGFITSVMGAMTARTQSSIKSQVAYSSISQIGLIFIEIALGWENFALVHIAGNAFLRTYQLLVSPSIASYKIREQFYHFKPKTRTIEDSWPRHFEYAMYMISLKEWNLDSMMYRRFWNPLKKLGSRWDFLTFKNVYVFFGVFFTAGLFLALNKEIISKDWIDLFPLIYAIFGLLLVIKSFTERSSARLSWSLIITNHFSIAIAISFNGNFEFSHYVWYLSGIIVGGLVGYLCIQRLRHFENWVSLDKFYGHAYEHPKIALVFLLACLGLAGFPITPTFIGADLIFSHIRDNQAFLAFLIAACFILNGMAVIRIYARIFLGPHIKRYHDVAKRSS